MTLSVICQTSVFAAFSDVGDDNTYKDAITTLTKLKVIDGYEDGTFKPDGQITRAEFTKLIVFILGYKDLAYDSSDLLMLTLHTGQRTIFKLPTILA